MKVKISYELDAPSKVTKLKVYLIDGKEPVDYVCMAPFEVPKDAVEGFNLVLGVVEELINTCLKIKENGALTYLPTENVEH